MKNARHLDRQIPFPRRGSSRGAHVSVILLPGNNDTVLHLPRLLWNLLEVRLAVNPPSGFLVPRPRKLVRLTLLGRQKQVITRLTPFSPGGCQLLGQRSETDTIKASRIQDKPRDERGRACLASVRGSVRGRGKTGVRVERTLRQRLAQLAFGRGPFEVTLVVRAVPKYHSVRVQNPNSSRWNVKPKRRSELSE